MKKKPMGIKDVEEFVKKSCPELYRVVSMWQPKSRCEGRTLVEGWSLYTYMLDGKSAVTGVETFITPSALQTFSVKTLYTLVEGVKRIFKEHEEEEKNGNKKEIAR